MASVTAPDRTHQVVEILVKIEAALHDVFLYYKFGRHGDKQCEKPYFLLSHCSHLMFSLWLAYQEDEEVIRGKVPVPAAFTSGLDFGFLRYVEYSRRMVHADSIEEHLKNEPKWFAFWIQMLESFDKGGAGCFQEFRQQVLKNVENQTFLEKKTCHKDKKRLEALMQEDATGRLLLHSVTILEDLAQSIIGYLTMVDPRAYAIEQITAIFCLLGRIRRTIVCETPAKGPYVPSADKSWRAASSLGHACRGRTPGFLTVVPKRDGSGIVCRYDWASGDQAKSRQWMLKTSRLRHSYEEELFGTWSYQAGEYLQTSDSSSEARACWTLQAEEAAYIESLARQIDALLGTLQDYPICRNLVDVVGGVARNNGGKWKPGELSWICVEQVDKVLKKLKSACREARVTGGENPAQYVIPKVWSASDAPVDQQEPQERASVAIVA